MSVVFARLVSLSVLLAVVVASFTACLESCVPTELRATEGAVLDLVNVQKSSVLEARLTVGKRAPDATPATDDELKPGTPLEGMEVEFFVEYRDPTTGDERRDLLGEGETNADGIASTDLKNAPVDLVRAATEPSFFAEFTNDGEYCGSVDESNVRIVKAPGVSVPGLGTSPRTAEPVETDRSSGTPPPTAEPFTAPPFSMPVITPPSFGE